MGACGETSGPFSLRVCAQMPQPTPSIQMGRRGARLCPGGPQGAQKLSSCLQLLLPPHLFLGDTRDILDKHRWASLSSSTRVQAGEEGGGQPVAETGPLTPKSLKVQTALMARPESAHSRRKEEMSSREDQEQWA